MRRYQPALLRRVPYQCLCLRLGCIAVEFRTRLFSQQSRRAIERLGAMLDGVLRNHQRAANGTLRDTCAYSIVESEWPTVKAHLRWQLAKPRSA